MQRLETLEAENRCLSQQPVVSESQASSSEKTSSSDPVVPLQNENRKLRQLIRDLRQQNRSCSCQTDSNRPRQISRSPTNWNEKTWICGNNWKHPREKTIVRPPLFPRATAKKTPKSPVANRGKESFAINQRRSPENRMKSKSFRLHWIPMPVRSAGRNLSDKPRKPRRRLICPDSLAE